MRTIRLQTVLLAAVVAVATLGLAADDASAAAGPSVTTFALSQSWVSRRGGDLTVTFELRRPAAVVFSLTQVAPVCRAIGRFTVQGREGENRFRFPGRIDRRLLPAGTYRLAAPGASGPTLSVALVVEAAPAGREERRRALERDACGTAAQPRASAEGAAGDPGQAGATGRRRPLVLGCVLAAIALLGAASLPATAGSRAAVVLTRIRPAAALGGWTALGVAIGLYLTRHL